MVSYAVCLCEAGAEHVRFSDPYRPARSSVMCSACRTRGELHPAKVVRLHACSVSRLLITTSSALRQHLAS